MLLPSLRIVVGGVDYTYEAENITFSNVDPGGCEMASFDVQVNVADSISPGSKVFILDGLETIWVGRVAEPAKMIKHGWHAQRKIGAATTRISCEGAGAAGKDNQYSMIYVDRDITRWTDPTYTRQAVLIGQNFTVNSWQVGADPTNGNPSLVMSITGAWVAPIKPIAEVRYDAGPLNLVSRLYFQINQANVNTSDTNWQFIALSADADEASNISSSGNLIPWTGTKIEYFNPTLSNRFMHIQMWYSSTPAGADGQQYLGSWAALTVYGNHGLVGVGPDPVGFYPSDIAGDAAYRCMQAGAWLKLGRVDVFSQFIVNHYVQYTPVTHDQVWQDMAKLAPAHYGVWPSSSIFDDTPEFTFRAHGNTATAFCTLADCDEADVSERLANLYTSAQISYSDAAGTQFITTVTLPNAILAEVGIRRTVQLDLGISNASVAAVFASFALQVLYSQSRSAGTIDLPKRIRNPSGAQTPSHWLRAGIDRIHVSDLPFRSGLIHGTDSDSFRISRVESNVDTSSGRVNTRVEIDAGPNLVETLQARLAIAVAIGGAGGA